MFCSRILKLRLENIHKQTLRKVFNKYEKNYMDRLAEHDEVSIHQTHLQFLASVFMMCFFENHEIIYNLRCGSLV